METQFINEMNRTASERDEIQDKLKKGVSPGAKKTLQ